MLLKYFFRGVIYVNDHSKAFFKGFRAHGYGKIILDVNGVGRMGSSSDYLDHRHGNGLSVGSSEVSEKRFALGVGGSVGAGHGTAENGVGSESALVLSSIKLDHHFVYVDLVCRIKADKFRSDNIIDIFYSLSYALSAEIIGIAVPELQRLKLSGGSSGRNDTPSYGSAFKSNIDLNSGVCP